jgi:signal peptidase I
MAIDWKKIKISLMNLNMFFVLALIMVITMVVIRLPESYQVFAVTNDIKNSQLKNGDAVFIRDLGEYHIGDNVLKSLPSGGIAETKIVSKVSYPEKIKYESRQQNMSSNDPRPFSEEEIIGKIMFDVPNLGYFMTTFSTGIGIFIMLLIPLTFIIFALIARLKSR